MTVLLDGVSLRRDALVAVARGAAVELDAGALQRVAHAADFLAVQVARQEPIYGVSTGFGSNADKLLGAHPLRDELPGATASGRSPHIELQRNLIVTHAVCVGEPFAPEVVRAMLCIRINTLLRGHSGIRVQTLEALADMLNAGIVGMPASLENFDARRQRRRLCRRGGLIHGVMVPTHPAGRPLTRLNNPPGLPVNRPSVQRHHRSAAGKARQCVQKRSKGT